MNRAMRDRLLVEHETVIHEIPAAADTPAMYHAACSCGWRWSSRFYRNRAEADAATHMAAVEMFRTAEESRALARHANTKGIA